MTSENYGSNVFKMQSKWNYFIISNKKIIWPFILIPNKFCWIIKWICFGDFRLIVENFLFSRWLFVRLENCQTLIGYGWIEGVGCYKVLLLLLCSKEIKIRFIAALYWIKSIFLFSIKYYYIASVCLLKKNNWFAYEIFFVHIAIRLCKCEIIQNWAV